MSKIYGKVMIASILSGITGFLLKGYLDDVEVQKRFLGVSCPVTKNPFKITKAFKDHILDFSLGHTAPFSSSVFDGCGKCDSCSKESNFTDNNPFAPSDMFSAFSDMGDFAGCNFGQQMTGVPSDRGFGSCMCGTDNLEHETDDMRAIKDFNSLTDDEYGWVSEDEQPEQPIADEDGYASDEDLEEDDYEYYDEDDRESLDSFWE